MRKIGVEGVPFFGNLTGVGQYATRLIEATSKQNSEIKFEIVRHWWFFRSFVPPISVNAHLGYRVVKWMPPVLYYQSFKRLGWVPPYDLVALRKYDVFLFFNFVAFPVRKKTKSIVTIYDLSFIYHPEYTQTKNLPYMLKFVPPSIKNADRIITISENSKQEIMDYYEVPGSKITIIHPAVDHGVFKPQATSAMLAVTKKYGINKPYLLSLCTLEPRKNLTGVLEAFDKLPEAIKQKYALVLVGGKGWLDDELQTRFDELAKKYAIIKTGYAPDEDLPALYSGAELFVFPSFYEGFGMPPLEAMACGTPVITSNNSSLPEVVGEAAITLKASDTNGLSKQIENVLSDKKIAEELRQKGLAQAKKFTWQKSAANLISLLEEVDRK